MRAEFVCPIRDRKYSLLSFSSRRCSNDDMCGSCMYGEQELLEQRAFEMTWFGGITNNGIVDPGDPYKLYASDENHKLHLEDKGTHYVTEHGKFRKIWS